MRSINRTSELNFKTFTYFLVILFTNYNFGCMRITYDTIRQGKIIDESNVKITCLTLNDGTGIVFNEKGGTLIKQNKNDSAFWMITGINRNEKKVEIDLKDVYDVGFKKEVFDWRIILLAGLCSLPAVYLIGMRMNPQ
jgi:hypothetical protein